MSLALDDLHSRNVVHCDVKPANLAFFHAEHKWKLLDLDSALEVGVDGEITTTITYASPEVLEAVVEGKTHLALQPSADMWAYGIIAFEVFTGSYRAIWSSMSVERGLYSQENDSMSLGLM